MNEHYYNSVFNLCSCHATIYSYSQNADMPILFSHYNHESTIPPHSSFVSDNKWCSIFISLSSNFSFILGDHLYTPSYGDIVVIRENENYISYFHSSSHMDYYEINFPPEFFEKVQIDAFSDLFYSRDATDKNMIILDTHSSSKLMECLKQIESIINSKRSIADILVYSYIIQIMDIICVGFHKGAANMPASAKFPQKLMDALVYIHSNYTTMSCIEDILNYCGISNAYLAKIFNKYLSCSVNRYITNLRISHAKYLLLNGATLTDACFLSGFNNYTYFISKFKSITGLSPNQFKKQQLNSTKKDS